MCKCEIGKCAHAESKLLDGKIRCSVRGETVALKRCPDYVPFVVTNENIKNKFPEIKFFIENPTSYEVLYHQDDRVHNEYPLEVEEAKAIFNYIDYLESKCKKQIDKLKNQQKEFIKYLQEELNVQIQEESIGCEITNKRYILEEILQKYKEIIGDDK